jgi:hypothetical protein
MNLNSFVILIIMMKFIVLSHICDLELWEEGEDIAFD